MTITAQGRRSWMPLAAVAVAVLIAAVLFSDPLGRLRDAVLGAPQPPSAGATTLLELRKTAELRAATGTFSVPIYFGFDEQTGLRRLVPDFLDENSGVAIYQGSVDALIDLKGLTEGDLTTDDSGTRITIRVPRPVLTEPNIDEAASRIVAQNRGLATRVGDFFDALPLAQREPLDDAAVVALSEAAAQSQLLDTAQTNGRDFLTAIARSFGFETVSVLFDN